MSFSNRIRLYLLVIAMLPPALMLATVYFYFWRQHETLYRQNTVADVEKIMRYRTQFQSDLATSLQQVQESPWYSEATHLARLGYFDRIKVDAARYGLDFLEVLDSNGQALASSHRPGLVGEQLDIAKAGLYSEDISMLARIEYDTGGSHTAMVGVTDTLQSFRLYGGQYLNRQFRRVIDQMIRGEVSFFYDFNIDKSLTRYSSMEKGSLYRWDDSFEVLIAGGQECGFFMVARFDPDQTAPHFTPYFNMIILVALAAALIALGAGLYISNKAEREIKNLVDAFSRVAAGDFTTTVMAYEEGEFSQLADAFSEMTQKLRTSQKELAVAEKIAAWEAIGRKVAHEIKNPLTPIAICADDLRRSYQDKLPDFDETLDRSTRTIKEEIARLGKLLDEFVGFARMNPPSPADIESEQVLTDLESLYRDNVESGQLRTTNSSHRKTILVDSEQIKQVLVNLVKNSLETSESVTVDVTLADTENGVSLTVRDDGPGFLPEALQHAFEPYVSTKDKGSGLGLVVCQRIVHDHGGTMEISNRSEGGAEVIILLPQE